jgi:large subunit ribosomal protein L12|tara:strand:- start:14614 stop:14928 length:315 start_codon:yes stop_codon:yes gene_type:complete
MTNLVYAAMLLDSASQEVNEANVKKITDALGVQVEEAQIKALVAALDGVNIKDVIKEAMAQQVVAAAPAQAQDAKGGEKKEAKKAEEDKPKAEEAAAGLSNLFG